MRKFQIGNKKANTKDGYYVKIKFMFGDADGYTDKRVGPFKKGEEEYLDMFLTMLDKCLKAFPNGKGGFDTYEIQGKVNELKLWNQDYEPYDEEEVEEYDKFLESIEVTEKLQKLINRIKFKWPCTPDDFNSQAEILEYKVEYCENNTIYKVTIIE